MRKRRSGAVGPRKAATPKAGPKKRRSRAEIEEARRREAVAKHGKGIRNVKRATKPHTYRSKKLQDPAKAQKPGRSKAFTPVMGKPRGENVPSIVRWIEKNLKRFDGPLDALRHYQEKVCQHDRSRVIARSIVYGVPKEIMSCDNCGRVNA